MNKHAANAGDVIKHLLLAELIHIEQRHIRTYIDTHAGRPWNNLTHPDYLFGSRNDEDPAWAARFMKEATDGTLGQIIQGAEYTKLLQIDGGHGRFWNGSRLSSPPVYPGSVAVAHMLLSSHGNNIQWFCGEKDMADQAALASLLPGSVVESSLFPGSDPSLDDRLRRSLGPDALVFVDPFSLAARKGTKGDDPWRARAFAVHAARQGALVVAWYSLRKPTTPTVIERELWSPLNNPPLQPRTLARLEIRWSQDTMKLPSQPPTGAGMIMANLRTHTVDTLIGLSQALSKGFDWSLS